MNKVISIQVFFWKRLRDIMNRELDAARDFGELVGRDVKAMVITLDLV